MSNHIAIKFAYIKYSKIPQETFSNKIGTLLEKLRKTYPRHELMNLNEYEINIEREEANSSSKSRTGMLILLDAKGKYGFKIDSSCISLSVSEYVPFSDLIKRFKSVVDAVTVEFDISHYSKTSLKNLNLFNQNDDGFIDVKDSNIWGTQDFDTLFKFNYSCQGAATRHIYVSEDGNQTLNISSAILFKRHSYVPQSEWDVWKLRGNIPTAEPEKDVQLIIDLESSTHSARIDSAERDNVTEYNWNKVEDEFNEMHKLINAAYTDIICLENNL